MPEILATPGVPRAGMARRFDAIWLSESGNPVDFGIIWVVIQPPFFKRDAISAGRMPCNAAWFGLV
jgi:hypothetical protein